MPRNTDPAAVQLRAWITLYARWFGSNTSAFIREVLPPCSAWAAAHPGQAAANRVRNRQSEVGFPLRPARA